MSHNNLHDNSLINNDNNNNDNDINNNNKIKKKKKTKHKNLEGSKNTKKRRKSKKSKAKNNHDKRLKELKSSLKKSYQDFNDKFEEIGKEIGTHNYEIVALLGVGAQGKVYLVRFLETKELYAMKVFEKESIIDNDKTIRSVLTEQRFLATTSHPFITKLYHSFHSHERLFMVMEYCPGGELWTIIKNQPSQRFDEDKVRFYASEVLLVLEYVHSKGYIYRDLKPENILLHLDGHIRMADFGLSKQSEEIPEMKLISKREKKRLSIFSGERSKSCIDFSQGAVIKTDSLVGSVHYLAPEVLSIDGSYDVMADWWSFGVLLYDMFYGVPPFQGRCNEEVIMKIVQGEYKFYNDFNISSELKSLIKGLLKLDPKKRICAKRGANDIKRHPFFNNLQWGLLRNRNPPIVPKIQYPEDISNFELFDDEEDEVNFKFFSELPEDKDLLSPEEQKHFENFTYTRKSFAQTIVGDIKESNSKHKGKRRGRSVSRRRKPKRKTSMETLVRSKSEVDCIKDLDAFSSQNDFYFDALEFPQMSNESMLSFDKDKDIITSFHSARSAPNVEVKCEQPESNDIILNNINNHDRPIINRKDLFTTKKTKRKPTRKT